MIGVAAIAKLIPGALVIRHAAGVRSDDVWPPAAALLPRAEISLIIAQYGVTIGITPDLLAVAMAVMIGTTVLPSPIIGMAKRRTPEAKPAE